MATQLRLNQIEGGLWAEILWGQLLTDLKTFSISSPFKYNSNIYYDDDNDIISYSGHTGFLKSLDPSQFLGADSYQLLVTAGLFGNMTTPESQNIYSMKTLGGTNYAAVGGDSSSSPDLGIVMFTDNITNLDSNEWVETILTAAASADFIAQDIASNGTNQHVIVGNDGIVWKSSTSLPTTPTWTEDSVGVSTDLRLVRYSNTQFVAAGDRNPSNDGVFYHSSDGGDTWTEVVIAANVYVWDFIWDTTNSQWIFATSQGVFTWPGSGSTVTQRVNTVGILNKLEFTSVSSGGTSVTISSSIGSTAYCYTSDNATDYDSIPLPLNPITLDSLHLGRPFYSLSTKKFNIPVISGDFQGWNLISSDGRVWSLSSETSNAVLGVNNIENVDTNGVEFIVASTPMRSFVTGGGESGLLKYPVSGLHEPSTFDNTANGQLFEVAYMGTSSDNWICGSYISGVWSALYADMSSYSITKDIFREAAISGGTPSNLKKSCSNKAGIGLIGGLNNLIKTTNGGPNFAVVGSLPSPWDPQGFIYGEGNIWVAFGDDGQIWRSSDNGDSWTSITTGLDTTYDFRTGVYLGNSKWIIAGASGRIVLSIDDGLTWSAVTDLHSITPSAPNITDMIFTGNTRQTIVAVAYNFFCISVDLGDSWSVIQTPLIQGTNPKIAFLDGYQGRDRIAIIDQGKVHYTRNF